MFCVNSHSKHLFFPKQLQPANQPQKTFAAYETLRLAIIHGTLRPGLHKCSRNVGSTSDSAVPDGDMQEIPYWGLADNKHHRTLCSRQGDLASKICAHLPDIYNGDFA
jgi:hypothetical protein